MKKISRLKKAKVCRKRGKPFKPGEGGRPKGVVNKFTSLKQDFMAAYHLSGGVIGLAAWIKKSSHNRGIFYTLLARLLPSEVGVDIGNSPDRTLKIVVVNTKGDPEIPDQEVSEKIPPLEKTILDPPKVLANDGDGFDPETGEPIDDRR